MTGWIMIKHRIFTVLLGVSVLALGACSDSVLPRTNLAGAKYWERSDASSSVYLEGPKAQQMLQRDIARCVTEIRELERLGSIRHAMPADPEPSGGVPDLRSPEGALAQYEITAITTLKPACNPKAGNACNTCPMTAPNNPARIT
jgi:hypothetical protein